MSNRITRMLAALALGIGLVAGTAPALAAPVQQAFTLQPDFGSVAPVSGSFTYDDSQTPPLQGGERHFDLTGFELVLDGTAYSLPDLGDAYAVFDATGFIGLQVTIDGVLTLSPSHGQQQSFFAWAGVNDEATGDIGFAAIGTVGEPASAALLLLALATAAAARRRRSSRV